jgi:hypothetical protein
VLEKFTSQKLAWATALLTSRATKSRETFKTKGVDCARLTVPLDYSKATGDTITLGVLRHQAGKADQRIGSLVINPGGSGMTAAASTGAKGERHAGTALRRR